MNYLGRSRCEMVHGSIQLDQFREYVIVLYRTVLLHRGVSPKERIILEIVQCRVHRVAAQTWTNMDISNPNVSHQAHLSNSR
jgi:hypothetical protein